MTVKHIIAAAILGAAASFTALAGQAKYIFYFIGDGMGMGPIMAAENYNRTVVGNDTMLTMMQFPVQSWVATFSASSLITDSAAAGTALSTGHKTKNSMLGMAPDTTDVQSVAATLAADGYGIGVVTSVAPDDATPGAFYAHVPHRKIFDKIDYQMATSGYQFVAGAGLRGTRNDDGTENGVLDLFARENVQIIYGPDQIDRIVSDKVLLLNPEGSKEWNIGYTIDSIAGVLNLPLITETCLKHLQKTKPQKFFMMVEGGNIDHALHANDGGAAIKEIVNFNQAIELAYRFYQQHPDETLIVVTADHDTGGMAYVYPTGNGLANIDYQRVSKEEFSDYCKGILKSRRIYTWQDMKEYLAENLGLFTHIKLNNEQEENLRALFDKTFQQRNSHDQETLYASFNEFAVAVFSYFNAAAGLAFTTTSHSGNPVPVFAIGVGADRFRGLRDNTAIPTTILSIARQ